MSEDKLPESIQVGLWLGSENKISRMVRLAKGWKAVDTTGALYYQAGGPTGRNFPEGLCVSFISRDGSADDPVIPWPNHSQPKRPAVV